MPVGVCKYRKYCSKQLGNELVEFFRDEGENVAFGSYLIIPKTAL